MWYMYILGGILAGMLIVSALGYFIFWFFLKPRESEKQKDNANKKKSSRWSWIKHPVAIIVYVLIVLNLILKEIIPWLWDIIAYNPPWSTVIFNLGFWTAMYLRTIKVKDAAGNDTKEKNPTAIILANIMVIVLVLGFCTTAWYAQQRGDLSEQEYKQKVATEKEVEKAFNRSPVILRAIAKCRPEEFNTAEKIFVAAKKYQTEGVESWLPDAKCWVNYIPKGTIFTLAVVEVISQEEWSRQIFVPTIGGYIVSADCPPNQDYETRINGDDAMIVAKGDNVDNIIYSLEFSAVDENKAVVTVVMKPATRVTN